MFLSLLFGLFSVFGNRCYTQRYRTEMSYVMCVAFRTSGSSGEHVCLLCIADSSQNIVFIVREANKTSPTAHLDLGYGFAITSKTMSDSDFLQCHWTLVSPLHPATNSRSAGSQQWLFLSFLSLNTCFLEGYRSAAGLNPCDIFLDLCHFLLSIW